MAEFDGEEMGLDEDFDQPEENFDEDLPEGREDGEEFEEQPEEQPARRQSAPNPNAIAAQHRILQRNYDVLERRFGQVVEILSRQQRSQEMPEGEDEEIPDPDENLGGHLVGKMTAIEKRLQREEEDRAQRERDQSVVQQFHAAQGSIASYREQAPELYDAAAHHLLASSIEELRDFRPDLTEEEIHKAVAKETAAWVLRWHQQGLNPGEQVMRMALRRGFNGQGVQQPAAKGGGKGSGKGGGKRRDPREEIADVKDQQRRGRTLAAVPGASARATRQDPRRLLQLPEDEWEKEMKGIKVTDILKMTGVKRK
jgi:hypothetical protein